MSDDRLDKLDYYTLLGITDDVTTDAIKAAFRSFARRYHPDRFVDATDEKRDQATRIFRRGSEAFQVLTDESQRRAYDRLLAQGKLRLTEDTRASAEVEVRAMNKPKPRPAAEAAPAETAATNPIRNEKARAFFQHAVEAAKAQDWATAWKALRAANHHEPGNAFLETRFRQVDAMLRKA